MATDSTKLKAVAERHADPVRCPFCVEGNEFKKMTDLSGGAGDAYYCTACRHLVRNGQPEFHCLCPNCRAMAQLSPGT